ncbi:unnamed protein product [Paramecium octaurelia]|uniref:Uncharacterized protein n=1 Tax=Paramecium octaurelia TaxID=43137 RepID=A0A8S1UPB2_PAROT|nr:unnamed protein product [Paramecium octaurelia]
MPKQQQQKKRAYAKVSYSRKEALRSLVFQEGFKIKQAAQQLSINYASAKTIIIQFRQRQMRKCFKYLSMKPCLVKQVSQIKCQFKIISQTGGEKVNEKVYDLNCLKQYHE